MNLSCEILPHQIQNVFNLMEVAERVISKFKVLYPDQADLIHESFLMLAPSDILKNCHESIYEHHCSELIQRKLLKKDLTWATKAEIISMLSFWSLQAPPSPEYRCLYFTLFKEVFPESNIVIDYDLVEPIPNSNSELLYSLQKKFKQERLFK